MKTWKMNLLDNRSDKKRGISDKFNFCKEKGIVGIGWVGYEEIGLSQDDKEFKAFISAKSKLEQFDVGDLVWVKVPKEFKLWLCVIKSKMIKADDEEFNENDVGYYCECEYIRDFASKDLPKKVLYESLTTRSAISNAVDEINDATNNIYQKLIRKKKSIKELFSDILKNIKKYWYIYATALAIIIASIVTISILNVTKAKQVREYINGKTFIIYDSNDFEVYSFKDDKFAYVEGYSYKSYSSKAGQVEGDITDYAYNLKIKASVFSDVIWISDKEKYSLSGSIAVCLKDGAVEKYKFTNTTPSWREITHEEFEKSKLDAICEHEYSDWIVTKDATCSVSGSRYRTCGKCGKVDNNDTFTRAHKYVNGYCSVCGQKEPVTTSGVQADVWYKSTDVDALKVKNCSIKQTWPTSTTVPVKYASVCKHCHVESLNIQYTIVEFGVPIKKNYICPRCNKATVVELTLN